VTFAPRSAYSLLVAVIVCSGALLPARIDAQGTTWRESWVGSDMEIYLRALAIAGASGREPWAIRPFAPRVLDTWAATTEAIEHPWREHARMEPATAGFHLLQPAAKWSYNSAFPWGGNDGAAWQGRGQNFSTRAGVAWRLRFVSIRLEPTFFWAQNGAYTLLPSETPLRPLADAMRASSIDLPQRFGTSAYARLDMGQSSIRFDAFGLTAEIGTENLYWGPTIRNPLLLGPNAAGIPHLALGTADGLRTPIGRFHGHVMYGRAGSTALAPDSASQVARFVSGMVLSWSPNDSRAFEVGSARIFHKRWPRAFSSDVLLAPFGAAFASPSAAATLEDNQLAELFVRVAPGRGLEFFGEFGKNDRNADLRDLEVEPDHNAAWAAGFFATIGSVSAPAFWTLRGEVLDGRITSLVRMRPQATFYEHGKLAAGHTNLGQLLGSPLMERTGGFEVAADRWSREGRVGWLLEQRFMPPDQQVEGVTADRARSQWYFELNATRFRSYGAVHVRGGLVFDFNRTRGHDAFNLSLAASIDGVSRAPKR